MLLKWLFHLSISCVMVVIFHNNNIRSDGFLKWDKDIGKLKSWKNVGFFVVKGGHVFSFGKFCFYAGPDKLVK